jgi:signal transduction histidine kinase
VTQASSRRRLLAWALFAVAMTQVAVGLSLMVRTLDEPAIIFGFRGDLALLTFSFSVVGLLLATRRPRNAIGWILLGTAVAGGLQLLAGEFSAYSRAAGDLRAAAVGAWIDGWIWVPVTGSIAVHIFLLFPTGKVLSPRWRWIRWIGSAGMLSFGAAFAFGGEDFTGAPNPFFDISGSLEGALALGAPLFLAGVLGGVASLIVRFRRSVGDERQQLRWFATAATFLGVGMLATFVNEFFLGGLDEFGRIASVGMVLGFIAIPATIGISILKYRLYDLDVVISRAVLYGALVAIITLVYVAIVVGVGALIGSEGNVLLSVLATALIAIAFQPLRERVRRFANRLVYGKRATPYEVLGEFAERMGETYATEHVLPRLARLLGEGTGATRAEVWLRVGGELRSEAFWPESVGGSPPMTLAGDVLPDVPDVDRAEPVLHHGELLGMITVAKPRGESMTAPEEKLIAQVASQAGLVLRNVRLIEELQASRQRLVAAQDDERRRLERNIHDGAQQQLVALTVKMRLVEAMSSKDPAKAAELARQAKGELQDALEDLRDLARGIYPPLLADQGLAAALEAQARKAAVPVEVHPDGVGRYPKEVEAGAYFCVLEALQNVAKYADASRVDVTLRAAEGELIFEVTDDGKGFDPARTPHGSGLTNMRDRLEAMGGSVEVRSRIGQGTTVAGRVPADGGKK